MHTAAVVGAGLALLAACSLVGAAIEGKAGIAPAALAFLPLWLVGAAANMYVGVRRAGYSLADEAPVFLVVFAVPATAALLAWWRLR